MRGQFSMCLSLNMNHIYTPAWKNETLSPCSIALVDEEKSYFTESDALSGSDETANIQL